MTDGGALTLDALRRQPETDGILCVTDTLALGALRGSADAGRDVPRDLLVVGFDDVPQAEFSIPSLTSVAPGHDEMVEATVRLLMRRMRDRTAAPEHIVSGFRLVERESTRR